MTDRRRRPVVAWTDLGRAPYAPVWSLQRDLVARLRTAGGAERLLIVEHEPVITLGRRAEEAHIVAAPGELESAGVSCYRVERGGDVTYHGPGQLVAYPILDLRRHKKDVRWFSQTLLAAVVEALGTLGVEASARGGAETGVWVSGSGGRGGEKIAALGVRIEGWVTYHGVAINVAPDLTQFDAIVPCGLPAVTVTSVAACTGGAPSMTAARDAFLAAFARAFDVDLEAVAPPPLNLAAAGPPSGFPPPRTGEGVPAATPGPSRRGATLVAAAAAVLALAAAGGMGGAAPAARAQDSIVATPRPAQPVDWPELPDVETLEPITATEHFEVYVAEDDLPLLEEAAMTWSPHLEAILTLLASRLKQPLPQAPIRVIFASAYVASCPARGLAFSRDQGPVIAAFVGPDTGATQVRAVLGHEISHALTMTDDFVGDGVLTEGIANWAPGGIVRQWQGVSSWSAAARAMLADGSYVSVADPDGLTPGPGEDCLARRDRAYNVRAAFTEWLIKRLGVETVVAMPARVIREAQEGSVEPRVRREPDYEAATGFTLAELEAIWLAQLTGTL